MGETTKSMHTIKITNNREQLVECIEYEQKKDFHRVLEQFKNNPIYKECLLEESKGQKVASLKVNCLNGHIHSISNSEIK